MALTILIAAFAVCGVFLIFWALLEAMLLPMPETACHIVYLRGSCTSATRLVRSALWRESRGSLRGKLIFVDCGLDAEAQTAVELLLRNLPYSVLCAREQLTQYIETERDACGTGAD